MTAREASRRRDPALTDRLGATIGRLLPVLDAFTRFEGPHPAVRRSAWRAALDEPLPERGQGPDAVLRALEEVVVPNGLRIGHPGFSGWVTTMPTTIPTAAYLAAAVAAPQRWWASPGNFLEYLALDWLKALLGVPAGHAGVFVSGGAVANLVGMAAARQHAGERIGVDPARDGVAGIPSPVAYASPEVHHVLLRAMGVLGLGRRNLRMVGLDRDRRLDAAELERAIDADVRAGRTPIAIVANAGDVNTGIVDPIDELARIARERGIWLHVDGAYGGFGLLDERVRSLYGDVGAYDSFAVDPHKWMNVPVGCGAAFVRDPDLLGRALTPEPADYAQPLAREGEGDTTSPFDELGLGTPDHTVEFSAPSRGMTVWAVLKEIGAAGMRERVRRD
ncbi:MAG TPA: aminotransferase class V-fold PLP-dependent enzyme, partial [Candidatus Limnocylindrales bacterium]|nr:aminotransferase class V-fold PLP-dependent enzyme [Candidatus Limnocylindrales bacterium]